MKRRSAASRSVAKNATLPVCCAAWLGRRSKGSPHYVLFARGDSSTADDASQNKLDVARYDSKTRLVSEPEYTWSTEDGSPCAVAVHPKGHGIVVSFSNSCKLFEVSVEREQIVKSSALAGEELNSLRNVGPQDFLVFSPDGSKLASGTKEGHLRVFQLATMTLIVDQPKTLQHIKDVDISLDSALLAVTGGGSCQVWNLQSAALEAVLSKEGDSFDCCRFSRNGKKPFLFVTVNRGGKGYIGVWVIEEWSKCLGLKKVQSTYITALAVTPEGKRLAVGGSLGQITIIDVQDMIISHRVQSVQLGHISSLQFSQNGRELLSVAQDHSAEISPIHLEREWKDWELYLMLVSLFVLSIAIAVGLYERSDSFWNFPMGRLQPARPPIEAIYPS